jgi:hypothetical protein
MDADTNPYQPPSPTTADDQHRSKHRTQAPTRQGVRFALFSSFAGVTYFLCWCVLDLITVRVLPYPERCGEFDWTMAVVPFVICVVALEFFRSADTRLTLAILATIVALCLAVLLVVFFGISFHFAIGGSL